MARHTGSLIICGALRMALLTMAVNVFCSPLACARIGRGASTTVANVGITLTENTNNCKTINPFRV
jgi:hypothetical protein